MSLVGFTRLGSLTAPSVTGSASDLPTLVKYEDFTSTMLASLDSGGGDLRFSSDEAGTTQLACEVVTFTKATGDVVWVKVPSVATGALIYVWGNNTGATQPAVGAAFGRNAVWVDYEAVIHANETGTAGVFADSTGNGYGTTLTTGSSLSTITTGHPFGQSWPDFNLTQALTLTNSAAMLNSSPMGMSCWVNMDTSGGSAGIIGTRWSSSDNNFFTIKANLDLACKGASSTDFVAGAPANGVTRLLVVGHDSSSMDGYINGALSGTDTTIANTSGIIATAGKDYRIGTYYDNSSTRRINGRVGECRFF